MNKLSRELCKKCVEEHTDLIGRHGVWYPDDDTRVARGDCPMYNGQGEEGEPPLNCRFALEQVVLGGGSE